MGGAGGVCICFIGKSVLVVSQKTLRGMDAVACSMSSTTIVQKHNDRSDRLDLRARDADGGLYRRRVAERLPRSTSLALGSRLREEELHLVPAGRRGAARLN